MRINAFFISYLTIATALEVIKIHEIGNKVKLVKFDSESNVYVVSKNGDYADTLYKLDSQKDILWRTQISGKVQDIIVNSQNDVYLFLSSNEKVTISFIAANTTDVKELDVIPYYGRALIDNEDNLIYSSGTFGVKILRKNESAPILVKNVENFQTYTDSSQIADHEGNIYLGGVIKGSFDFEFVVITKQAMQEEIPQAEIMENVLENPSSTYVEQLLLNDENNIFLSTADFFSPNTTIKKIVNGIPTTVLHDTEFQYHVGSPVRDRVIYAFYVYLTDLCKISYIASDDKFFPILNLQNVSAQSCNSLQFTSDKNGNVFIGSLNKIDNSSLEFLNYSESESIGVNFKTQADINVMSMAVDDNDDLWVLTQSSGLYFVENTSLNATAISGTQDMLLDGIKRNKYNDEIFLYGFTGLYVIAK